MESQSWFQNQRVFRTLQMGLFVRTVGITRAIMRIGLANIVYNMRRFLFLERINQQFFDPSTSIRTIYIITVQTISYSLYCSIYIIFRKQF
ncbi:hypothetical protein A0U94_14225 (plasmid) [Gluconobacter albidus]|nr:hypothetical protein A0U94_14225 [Gluconobacter albidus]